MIEQHEELFHFHLYFGGLDLIFHFILARVRLFMYPQQHKEQQGYWVW